MKKVNDKNTKKTKTSINKNTEAYIGKSLTAEEKKALKNLKTPR